MTSFEEMQLEQIKKAIQNLNFSINSLIEIARFCGGLVDKKVKEGAIHGRNEANGRNDRLERSRATLGSGKEKSIVCVSGKLRPADGKGTRPKAVSRDRKESKRG